MDRDGWKGSRGKTEKFLVDDGELVVESGKLKCSMAKTIKLLKIEIYNP